MTAKRAGNAALSCDVNGGSAYYVLYSLETVRLLRPLIGLMFEAAKSDSSAVAFHAIPGLQAAPFGKSTCCHEMHSVG